MVALDCVLVLNEVIVLCKMRVLIDCVIAIRRAGSLRLAAGQLGLSSFLHTRLRSQNMLCYHVLGPGIWFS